PPADPKCSEAAKARLGDGLHVNNVERVAGVVVHRYRTTGNREKHEIALAPQFGCDLLEETSATYNSIGLPTSYFRFIVRSYLPGEPSRELFSPPIEYSMRDNSRFR